MILPVISGSVNSYFENGGRKKVEDVDFGWVFLKVQKNLSVDKFCIVGAFEDFEKY